VSSSTTDAAPRPRLSVVVASPNDGALLMRCVESLVAQADAAKVEILVVRDVERSDGFDRAVAESRFPDVRWIEGPPGCTVPHLRSLGIAASRGEVVALLEDDCLVQEGWCEVAMSITEGPFVAVGGAVEPGPYTRTLDWAVYFCEYARFMLPVPRVQSPPLPGNNVAYKRSALAPLPADAREGFQEVFVQAEWRRAGLATSATDALVVQNVNSWPLGQVTSIPFHHGRAFAARRFQAKGALVRVAISVLTLCLPALHIFRLFGETMSRGRLVGRMVLALPWVIVFTTSWSIGEAMGCVFGAGTSASRWR
jgi:glycosyltransferase involved in cell wall biosynthesis